MPSNDTTGLPDTDDADSSVLLRWTDQGEYHEGISRVLENEFQSYGIEKGALVHFYENITWPSWNDTTSTPWIAFINCDKNSSAMSNEEDVFSQVVARGAGAALMYSTTSQTCKLNPAYLDPEEFDKVIDIYTTLTKSSARLIESQFQNINKSEYYFFNAQQLNDSAAVVHNAIEGNGVEPGYLIATVKLSNVTDPDTGLGPNDNPSSGSGSDNQGKGGSTGLAMIILYAITGCVSALFCIVIITGAVRAIRHPERYGPRSGDPAMEGWEGEPQTRAAGITRAILDTFPVVKFGRGGTTTAAANVPSTAPAPVYGKTHTDSDIESAQNLAPAHTGKPEEYEMTSKNKNMDGQSHEIEPLDASVTAVSNLSRRRSGSDDHGPTDVSRPSKEDPTREMIGTEICPICITEFEEGDDLRVLPCDGKHKFHRDCVDPWLLQVSSLCPLCREDFTALENMASGVAPEHAPPPSSSQILQTPQQSANGVSRFSRYLRTAQRHHGHQMPGEASYAPHPDMHS
ncbi:hypothetical protein FRB90_003566 [Tulasnella sp. 427]|nr:hypothetical protein FRB90_003566 [Tulasnella sp. 427]